MNQKSCLNFSFLLASFSSTGLCNLQRKGCHYESYRVVNLVKSNNILACQDMSVGQIEAWIFWEKLMTFVWFNACFKRSNACLAMITESKPLNDYGVGHPKGPNNVNLLSELCINSPYRLFLYTYIIAYLNTHQKT